MSYSSTVLADSPLRYYRLGETSGTTAHDSSASAQNGTYSASGITYGVAGGIRDDSDTAVTLDGTAGTISSPVTGLPTGNGAFSFECLFRYAALPTGASFFLDFGVVGGNNLEVYGEGSDIFAGANANGSAYAALYSVTTNAWHHLVFTYDGALLRLYLDGVADSDHYTGATSANLSPDTLMVGAALGGGSSLAATLDEVAVYGVALTATQVQAHYAAAKALFGSATVGGLAVASAGGLSAVAAMTHAASATVGGTRGGVLASGGIVHRGVALLGGLLGGLQAGARVGRAAQVGTVTVADSAAHGVTLSDAALGSVTLTDVLGEAS